MFKDSYDGIRGKQVHIWIEPEVKPVYCKPRPVPYSLESKVEAEIKKLEQNSVLVKTDCINWATPIGVGLKANNTVKLHGGYKMNINQAVDYEQYPLLTSKVRLICWFQGIF